MRIIGLDGRGGFGWDFSPSPKYVFSFGAYVCKDPLIIQAQLFDKFSNSEIDGLVERDANWMVSCNVCKLIYLHYTVLRQRPHQEKYLQHRNQSFAFSTDW